MAGDGTYEEYERKSKEERAKNAGYLDEFEEWLSASNLKDKTITRHLDNVEFYLNDFLLHEDALSMEEGAYRIDGFLGDFFIRKCTWSSPSQVKQNAASLKKFYKCMCEKGHVTSDDLSALMTSVKENMDAWLDTAEDSYYGSPTIFTDTVSGSGDPLGFTLGGSNDADLLTDVFLESLFGRPDPTLMSEILMSALMGEGDGGPYDISSMPRDEGVASIALMYLYIKAIDGDEKKRGAHIPCWEASTTIDAKDVATLHKKGFVGEVTQDGKLVLSEEGMVHAEHLFEELGLTSLI